jgi:hypothetical protein
LLEWTGYKPSLAKRFFFGVIEPLPHGVFSPLWGLTRRRERLAELAMHGFRILHTNGFAFEALSKMAADTNNPGMQEPAAKALLTITNTPGQ